METISFNQLYAGLFLKYNPISRIDFFTAIKDFEKTTNNVVDNVYSLSNITNVSKYLKYLKNDTVALKDEYESIDQYLKDEKCTLRRDLEDIAGPIVMKYIEQLDLDKLKEKYYSKENKERIINEANILLISDNPKDIEAMKKYGFKNIDYFESIIIADKYFTAHPEYLEKYHIIIKKGGQEVQKCLFFSNTKLDSTLTSISHSYNNNTIVTHLYEEDSKPNNNLKTKFYYYKKTRAWSIQNESYENIFDALVKMTMLNETLDKIDLKDKVFPPIEDFINPNQLPLPNKISDLKILYTGNSIIEKYIESIANYLNLNITFGKDDNDNLGKNIKSNLGDYDIIIADQGFSDNLINLDKESTVQCKYSGRKLVLLVTKKDINIWSKNEDGENSTNYLGNSIELKYSFGGSLSENLEKGTIQYNVLRNHFPFINISNNFNPEYFLSEISNTIAMISSAVHIYNDAANKPLQDVNNLKSIRDYNKEYEEAEIELEQIIEDTITPILKYDELVKISCDYLKYTKNNIITKVPKNLIISEEPNSIRISLYENKKFKGSITCDKGYGMKNLRILSIQTNGNELPTYVGLYSKKYEKLEKLPKRPNEIQKELLRKIHTKVIKVLKPLVREAEDIIDDSITQDITLSYKRRKK